MASVTSSEPLGNFTGLNYDLPQMSASEVDGYEIDREESEITRLIDSGIIPSAQRIKEFMAVCAMKNEFDARRATVIVWLARMGMLEESLCCGQQASTEYKEALVIADSYKSS